MYDAGNSPITFMESIALSPLERITSDAATITDNVRTHDVANSPIESNQNQKEVDTKVDVKKMIMQLEKSGSEKDNLAFKQSPKHKIQTIAKPLDSATLYPEHITLHVKNENKQNPYETINLQSKLDEVIKTEEFVLQQLDKVGTTIKSTSDLETRLTQIVNMETNMLHTIDKMIDQHDRSKDSLCIKNINKEMIMSEKSDEHIKTIDITKTSQSVPIRNIEDIIEKKYIDTGFKTDEHIKQSIKHTNLSNELKQLIDEEEREQEKMYRKLMNENYTDEKKIY